MLLHKLAEEFEPHVWMNMHSGMEALFMPYDHLAALPDDAAGQSSFRLLRQLNALKCGGRCAVGSGGKSVGMPVSACYASCKAWPHAQCILSHGGCLMSTREAALFVMGGHCLDASSL